jgi:hypothetical protein
MRHEINNFRVDNASKFHLTFKAVAEGSELLIRDGRYYVPWSLSWLLRKCSLYFSEIRLQGN